MSEWVKPRLRAMDPMEHVSPMHCMEWRSIWDMMIEERGGWSRIFAEFDLTMQRLDQFTRAHGAR